MAEFVVPTVFKAVDKFSGTVAKIEKSTSKFASSAEKKLARVERRWRSVGAAAAKMGRSAFLVGTALLTPLVLVANEAVKFEKSMSNVSTLLDTTVEDMDAMGDQVLELAGRLPVPIEELTSALFDIRSADIDAADAMNVLETAAQLSVAGLGTVNEATDILTSAINSFKSEGLEAAEVADILFKTTKFGKTTIAELSQQFGSAAPIIESAGVSLAEFSAATSALTTSGLPAAQAQNQLKAAISNLKKPTKEMQQIFDALGVATDVELIEKFGGLVPAFAAIEQKAGEMDVNMSKAFGSVQALSAVTALLGANNEAYVTTLDAMVNGTGALNDAFMKQTETSAAQMQMAKNNIQAISIQLGQVLLPVINDLLKSLAPTIKAFGAWVKNNKPLVATIAKVTLGIAGLAFAVSGVSFLVAGFTKLIGLAKFGLIAFNVVTKVAAIAMKALNLTFMLSPIGLMIAGFAALSLLVSGVSGQFKKMSSTQKLANDVQDRALENTIDQRTEVAVLFAKLRMLEGGTQEYADTLAKVEAIQPGITDQYNLQEKSIRNLAAAEAELMQNILARAQTQAKSEILAEKTRELLELQMAGPAQESTFGALGQGTLDQMFVAEQLQLQNDINDLTKSIVSDETGNVEADPLSPQNINREQTTDDLNKLKSEIQTSIQFDFINMPGWMKAASGINSSSGGGANILPSTTSTTD